MDVGSGISVFACFLLLFCLIFKIKCWSDFTHIEILRKSTLFSLMNIATVGLYPSTFWYFTFRQLRYDYPSNVDTIIIPIITLCIAITIFLLISNIGLTLITLYTHFPCRLFPKRAVLTAGSIAWEILIWMLILIDVAALILFIIGGDHLSIPISMTYLYVLFAVRASHIR